MKNLGWLLVFIPALCTCASVLFSIIHYFHIIESADVVIDLMLFILVVNVLGCVVIAFKTSGNLPYLLFGNILFFIVFVFSITTVSHHDCSHHESTKLTDSELTFPSKPSTQVMANGLPQHAISSEGSCESCR
ncbi:hypothetical protein [Shewanella sp. UCD-KL12]|uniref:hypothetical protein n=1 Tax=Shewanella sp. UCD-KL12 TaxID=1917163 RepID=UPI0009712752|nr:hypothetical protein [Shewanella sp. UCD-KL12]